MRIKPRDARHLRQVGFRWWEVDEQSKRYGKLGQLNKHGKIPHSQRRQVPV